MTIQDATRFRRSAIAAGSCIGLGLLFASALVTAEDLTHVANTPIRAAKAGDVHEVSQREKSFAPDIITVDAGDEVVFLNDDTISHNVFSRSTDSKFNLKIQRPGEHKSYRFDKPGKSVVRCAIHPNMKLVVNVVEPVAAPDKSPPVPAKSATGTTKEPGGSVPAEVAQ